ncbi:MAG: adenosine deaminase [Candidatus Lokiarchaeota archaeon]|nr:adenosine deaminase [Candidatus Lokiarchaeota archaeon]
MNTLEAIRHLPKAELHIHLLGAVRPKTLVQIIKAEDIDTPYNSQEKMQKLFRYQNFGHFIEVYSQLIGLIQHERHFERLAHEVLEDCANQNIRYVELSFSSIDHVREGLDFEDMLDAIDRGTERAHRDFGILADIRIDLVRNFGPDTAMQTLDAIERKPENIVSVDIGGSEHKFPPQPFESVYERAKQMGLHLVAHAGEAAGPKSIWDAIKYLDVERVGHAVSAIDDPDLMKYMKEHDIAIESCPVSNLRTRAVESMERHPIREFYDHGLLVTVNSDDPTLFQTNLNNEYKELHRELDFQIDDLFQLSLNAVEASFLSEGQKEVLRKEFRETYRNISEQLDLKRLKEQES